VNRHSEIITTGPVRVETSMDGESSGRRPARFGGPSARRRAATGSSTSVTST
jgi:hypothetical protein